MLTEHNLELLTAFIDGELTQRRREEALRLLHDSSEARALVKDLQEAAHRIRELPRLKLDAAFARQVLEAIADRGLQTARSSAGRRHHLRWVAYAAAAVIVLAVGLGVFFATRKAPNVASVPSAPANPDVFHFKELAEEPKRELLAKKFKTETAVHLAMTVRDNVKAVDQLQSVMKNQGIKMIVDDRASANLRKEGQEKVEYLIYAENIPTEELAAMLRQLGDGPTNQDKSAFEFMVIKSLSTADRQNLAAALGVAAAEFEIPPGKDETSLFENTIIAAPQDKSKKAVPNAAGRPERFAMVMSNEAGNASSAEVQRFLAGRRRQQPGTVQVLIVIRQA